MARWMDVISAALEELSRHRPIFHSEADLQLALAWRLQSHHPQASIRLEKRVANNPRVELDILMTVEKRRLGIELKYPKRAMVADVDGEVFELPEGAGDFSRYEAIRDIERLERLVHEDVVDDGIFVLLTNAADIRQETASRRRVLYDEVRIHHGRQLGGTMAWGNWGTAGGRPRGGPVTLRGTYDLQWRDYSDVGGRQFRYLLVEVVS